VAATLDRSLTGCAVLFSCLDEEVGKVSQSADGHVILAWKAKAKIVWKHETFKGLLESMRGQQVAITLLLQLLQMCVKYLWVCQKLLLTFPGILCSRFSSC